jgi:hypothetical protein
MTKDTPDKIRIFINSRGKLESFAIKPENLYVIQVAVSEDLKDMPFDPIETLIKDREKEEWKIILGCDVIGRFTEKRHDLTIVKQYYKLYGTELYPLAASE